MKLSNHGKRILCFLVSFVIAVSFFGCSNTSKSSEEDTKGKIIMHADWPTYSDTSSLITASNTIIRGEVVAVDNEQKLQKKFDFPDRISKEEQERLEKSEAGYDVVTVSDVKVTKAIKGDIKEGTIIKVYQLGGKDKNREIVLDGLEYYSKGDRNLFFLLNVDGIYSTLNPTQGEIKLIDKKAQINKNNKLFKSGLSEEELISVLEKEVQKLGK